MANNPRHKENLQPFKKGHDPKRENNGRKKKLPAIDELLADVLGDEKDGVTAAKAILMALRARAAKGDVRAAEVLLERAYGKIKQPIENSGNQELTIRIVRSRNKSKRTAPDAGADNAGS